LKSKGLLSLILLLPEDWNYMTGGLDYICRDGKGSANHTIVNFKTKT